MRSHMASSHAIHVDVPAVTFEVPAHADILTIPHPAPPLADPVEAIARALAAPLGTPPLAHIVAAAAPAKAPADKTATVVVSDITRPDVPYQGQASILHPVLHTLEAQGILPEHITILVATGTHRATTPAEKLHMFGEAVVQRYPIIDHCATDSTRLRYVGRTASGTEVFINTYYLDADIKILTGEVKPHFMAGFSGGRKAICPGLANLETLQKFHSPQFLEHPCATNLVLEGNPCHQEATEVAERIGADFLINVTVDEAKRLTGVYAGDWRQAFAHATASLMHAVRVPVMEPYEILITIDATINHYQAAKAAVGALPILVDGGTLIQIANSSDGIGPAEYVHELELLASLPSHRAYIAALLERPVVRKDQWEVEMWCKVLEKVGGPAGLIYCTTGIKAADLEKLPLTSGYTYTGENQLGPMVQQALQRTLASWQRRLGRAPRLGVILDGAHAIPCLRQVSADT
jgi:nickel-dependent lactate racemase